MYKSTSINIRYVYIYIYIYQCIYILYIYIYIHTCICFYDRHWDLELPEIAMPHLPWLNFCCGKLIVDGKTLGKKTWFPVDFPTKYAGKVTIYNICLLHVNAYTVVIWWKRPTHPYISILMGKMRLTTMGWKKICCSIQLLPFTSSKSESHPMFFFIITIQKPTKTNKKSLLKYPGPCFPPVMAIYILVITGYFCGIIHSINGVIYIYKYL